MLSTGYRACPAKVPTRFVGHHAPRSAVRAANLDIAGNHAHLNATRNAGPADGFCGRGLRWAVGPAGGKGGKRKYSNQAWHTGILQGVTATLTPGTPVRTVGVTCTPLGVIDMPNPKLGSTQAARPKAVRANKAPRRGKAGKTGNGHTMVKHPCPTLPQPRRLFQRSTCSATRTGEVPP